MTAPTLAAPILTFPEAPAMTPREAWFFVTGLLMRDDDPAEYWRGFLDGQAEASEPMRPDDQFFLAGETWTGAERERARRRTATGRPPGAHGWRC